MRARNQRQGQGMAEFDIECLRLAVPDEMLTPRRAAKLASCA
jgi:hypothetical protein